jgi:V8-like Glu-specific endopeptidase
MRMAMLASLSGPRLALYGGMAAVASAALAFPAPSAAVELPRPGEAVASERLGGGAKAVASYWTRQRMRNAVPLTVEPPPPGAASTAAAPRRSSGEPILIPGEPPDGQSADAPPGPGQLASPSGSAKGAGPIPFTSSELTDTTSFPTRTHGIVFFNLGKFDYSCSGTVVQSPTQSVLMTAGHCVHAGGKKGPWASHFVFAPGYQDKLAPFGTWTAKRLFTTKGWRKRARFADDIGAARLNPNPAGQAVESVVGSRGIAFNLPRAQTYRAYGYPVDPVPKFDGESLWVCDSQFGYTDPYPEPRGIPQSGIGCDMGGGSSGGSWVIGDAYVNSSNSFGYAFIENVLFGPYYGNLAAKVYGKATGQ